MKQYMLISLFFYCMITYAQDDSILKIPEVDSVFNAKLTGELFYEKKQYIGDQYFNKDWSKGYIRLVTGEVVEVQSIKYSGLSDNLIWLNTCNLKKYSLDKVSIKEFWIENAVGSDNHFEKIKFKENINDTLTDVFAEVKVDGYFSLYANRKVSVRWPQYILIGNERYKYDVLESSPIYFIKLPSGIYLKVKKITKRNILKIFPTRKKELIKLVNENNLNLKREDHLVMMFELMNKL